MVGVVAHKLPRSLLPRSLSPSSSLLLPSSSPPPSERSLILTHSSLPPSCSLSLSLLISSSTLALSPTLARPLPTSPLAQPEPPVGMDWRPGGESSIYSFGQPRAAAKAGWDRAAGRGTRPAVPSAVSAFATASARLPGTARQVGAAAWDRSAAVSLLPRALTPSLSPSYLLILLIIHPRTLLPTLRLCGVRVKNYRRLPLRTRAGRRSSGGLVLHLRPRGRTGRRVGRHRVPGCRGLGGGPASRMGQLSWQFRRRHTVPAAPRGAAT